MEEQESDGAVWALHPFLLNQIQGEHYVILNALDNQNAKQLITEITRGTASKSPKAFAIRGSEVDLRMLMQLSVFTIHSSGDPLEEFRDAHNFLHKFTVSADAKKHILSDLDNVGIRQHILFPDLEHLAKHLAGMKFY